MWSLQSPKGLAEFNNGRFSFGVDLSNLGRGVVVSSLPFRILGIGMTASAQDVVRLTDAWTRGDDLIANYEIAGRSDTRMQFYWRHFAAIESCAEGIELILSIQADLPETPVGMTVSTTGPFDECAFGDQASATMSVTADTPLVRHTEAGWFVGRMTHTNLSYVEMVYPSDFIDVTVQLRDGGTRLESSLFPEPMEKGVIRRGRVRGVIIPRHQDQQVAQRQYTAFAQSAIPLTT